MSDATETPTPTAEPEAPPTRACASCSAPLADGQDWCLECGSAQPGRLGGRPGWRAALTVLGVTAVLVGGAGAAAYAALTSEAQRDATAAAPPQATPTVTTTPPVPAPAPTPTETTPTVDAPDTETPEIPAPSDGGTDTPESDPAPTPAPSTPSTPAPSGSGGTGDTDGGTDTGSGETTETTPSEPVAVDLPSGAAKAFDPFGRAAKHPSNPANAIDGKAKTAFELPVDPSGKVNAGLTLSLEETATLSEVLIKADTPGFTVEVYATRSSTIPPDVLDARWEHVGDRTDAGVEETVELDGKFRHVLLWITEQPADTKVAIPEVQLFD